MAEQQLSTMQNLEVFSRAVCELSPAEQSRFFQYFVGALSTVAPKNDWSKAIKTAAQLLDAGKENNHV